MITSSYQAIAGLIVSRWLFCTVLVLATYNPFGRSYYHWITGEPEELILKFLVGLLLVVVYVYLAWVIVGSVRVLGVLAMLAIWLLFAHQLLDLADPVGSVLRQTIVLLSLSTTLAGGLCWPSIIVRLSGQIEKRYLEGKEYLDRGAV